MVRKDVQNQRIFSFNELVEMGLPSARLDIADPRLLGTCQPRYFE